MAILLLWILVIYVTMVYGPIAAWLVELFPTRIRYTSASRCPITSATAGSAASCRRRCSPSWPRPATSIPACGIRSWWRCMSFVVGLIFLPETKDRDISQG